MTPNIILQVASAIFALLSVAFGIKNFKASRRMTELLEDLDTVSKAAYLQEIKDTYAKLTSTELGWLLCLGVTLALHLFIK